MKKLLLVVSPLGKGPLRTLTNWEIELAVRRGRQFDLGDEAMVSPGDGDDDLGAIIGRQRRFDRSFHGPQISAAEAALAIGSGADHTPQPMPTVFMGGYDILAEISTHKFRWAVSTGLSEFAAAKKVHGQEQIMAWAISCRLAVNGMFLSIADGEIAFGVFPGLAIALAVCGYGASELTEQTWSNLKPLEALILADNGIGRPSLAGKISAPQSAAA